VQHEYYHTDVSREPIEAILDRFVLCGEGRIDHLAGYLDGMEIWRKLHDEGVSGIIRGDEGFGWTQVSSELDVKTSVGCALCTDFDNLKSSIADFGLPAQALPVDLKKRRGESLSSWRDRLYQEYRLPTILAALSDIKLSYVEVINPLLSKSILTTVRSLPDCLRTDKTIFREIVDSIGPDVPYADKDATADPRDVLRRKDFVELLKNEIDSSYANQLFGSSFVRFILNSISETMPRSLETQQSERIKESIRKTPYASQIVERIKSLVPRFVKTWLRELLKPSLRDKALRPKVDGNVLAFRVFIIIKMHKTLKSDSTKFGS
jgi:hypothetical protein